MRSIIKTIIFCGRQELPLRGHRDHGPLDSISSSSENDGVFRALLRFRVDAGDSELEKHLQHGAGNAAYLSWLPQNEIINSCGNVIVRSIVEEAKHANYFAILVDDTTDMSMKEQCSISIRYVKDAIITERFLAFVDVSNGMAAQDLLRRVTETLHTLGLDTTRIRGQGYDGASTMSGAFRGLQAEIKKISPSAAYVHCASHVLNLTIHNSVCVPIIRNAIGQVKEVANFFQSPKRLHLLQGKCSNSSHKKLKSPCPTRWIEYHDSIIRFLEMISPIVSALEEFAASPAGKTFESNDLIVDNF